MDVSSDFRMWLSLLTFIIPTAFSLEAQSEIEIEPSPPLVNYLSESKG